MLKAFDRCFLANPGQMWYPILVEEEPSPESVQMEAAPSFPLASHITYVNQLPYLDWDAVHTWVDALPSNELQAQAWSACERAWLLHLHDALGTGYRLAEADQAMLLSSLEPAIASVTLEYMSRTLARIVRLLDGLAAVSEWGKDILIVFNDHDTYHRYVSYYGAEEGEFALSSGMYLHSDCAHFVTVKSDLREVEPVIAHEMTHACVGHLPLPAWPSVLIETDPPVLIETDPASAHQVVRAHASGRVGIAT